MRKNGLMTALNCLDGNFAADYLGEECCGARIFNHLGRSAFYARRKCWKSSTIRRKRQPQMKNIRWVNESRFEVGILWDVLLMCARKIASRND